MKTKKLLTLVLAALFTASLSVAISCTKDSGNTSQSSGETIEWKSPTDGDGGDYSRFECEEGYYKFDLSAGSSYYYSFSASQSGIYALYSLEKAEGVTVTRFDASAYYIPPTGEEAQIKEDGTFYAPVNCSDKYYNPQWRATYLIEATANILLKVRFERVSDPEKEPETFVTKVTAKEIAGIAPEGNGVATEVPWTNDTVGEWYYDKDYEMEFTSLTTGETVKKKGFYRMETGEVIWVAITSAVPERLYGLIFSSIQYEGNNLTLSNGTDTGGNFLVNNYVDFIMNNGGEYTRGDMGITIPAEGDPTMACYQNAVNAHGLFPVNQELFEFLSVYMKNNSPIVEEGETVNKKDEWLAACYYYQYHEPGTSGAPIELTSGDNTITIAKKYGTIYYKATADCTLSSTDSNLMLSFNKTNYGADGNGFTLTLKAGDVVEFMSVDFNAGSFTVTVSE